MQTRSIRIVLTAAITACFCVTASAQVFPEAQTPASPTPAAPAPPSTKTIIEGAQSRPSDAEEQAGVIEHKEDEGMVYQRFLHEVKRRRLPANEEKLGHAKLRLSGIDEVRKNKPTPATLPQLPTPKQASPVPEFGPSVDPQFAAMTPAGQIFGSKWVELGPSVVYNGQPAGGARIKVAGRTTALAIDPSDPTYQTLYLGGADGGVWKTTNHGTTWTALTDNQPSLAIGCITVNGGATNEVYVGTGEAVLSGDAKSGAGILLSTNSGSTWVSRQSATLGNTKIGQISIDRVTSTGATRRILAATHDGIYATNDAFLNVTQVQAGRFCNVIQDATNPQVWWATRVGTAAGVVGLYKSTNNGATFTMQSTGIPNTLPGGLADLVQAPSSPNTMYAVFNGQSDYSKLNIYKSTNGGANWNQIDPSYTASANSGQFFYNVYIAVNPINASEIYISGSAPLYRSTNGGSSFTNVALDRALHADHQFGLFRPDGARFYDCNDGGLFYTDNGGATDWLSMNTGLNLLQVNSYGLALHPTRFEILAGTQDNGTCRYLGTSLWSLASAGDGGVTLWDQTNPDYVYNGYVYDKIQRSKIAGYGWDPIGPLAAQFPSNAYSWPFYPKAALSPTNPNTLVFGGDSLLRNTNARLAATWTDATGKLSPGSQISAIAFAPSNGEICYLGFDNGRVYRTGNMSALNPSWSLLATHPSAAFCSDIAVDPTDPNHCVPVFYQFSGSQVYEITNAATSPTFTARSSGFPALAANCIVIDNINPGVWYVGTEVGVYRTLTAGASWQNFSTGLPNSAVDDLTLDNSRSILLAGTHGRGVWMVAKPELKLATASINDSISGGNGNGSLDQNERVQLTLQLRNTGSEIASGVAATLVSNSPGVVVEQGSGSYPDLLTNGTPAGNLLPFVLKLDPTVPAGRELKFTLTVASNTGNYTATIPVSLRAGVANSLLSFHEGFENGFGGFSQFNQTGNASLWQIDGSKPAAGAKCAHIEEPFPTQYQLDHLNSNIFAIPAAANRVQVMFDHTYSFQLGGYSGGKVFLVRDSVQQFDMNAPAAKVLETKTGYSGKFDLTFPEITYRGTDAFVNGGAGLPYSTTALELDPTFWAGHTLQVVFSFNYNSFSENRNGPTGWFIDDFRVKAENYSIQSIASAEDWQLLK